MTVAIQAKDIHKKFGDPATEVLKGLSFLIHQGEFVSLTGRSGSGKSTLLYLLSTLDSPSSGDIWLQGKNVQKMTSAELHTFRNRHMGFVFQFHYLLPELTALDNVLMPARKFQQQEAKRRFASELLEQFGLANKLESLPRQLSGGEQQRVAIARALIMEPSFLFADEPTGNLDSVNGEKVMQILKDINKTKGTSIIMVTHDPDFAAMASRQIFLADGRITSHL